MATASDQLNCILLTNYGNGGQSWFTPGTMGQSQHRLNPLKQLKQQAQNRARQNTTVVHYSTVTNLVIIQIDF